MFSGVDPAPCARPKLASNLNTGTEATRTSELQTTLEILSIEFSSLNHSASLYQG